MCSTPLAQSWGKYQTPKLSYIMGRHLEVRTLEVFQWAHCWLTGICGSLGVTHSCCMLLLPFSGSSPSSYHSQFRTVWGLHFLVSRQSRL